MRRAFTLVELLVVIGMIAILMGAVGSGVSQARKRAMIARATQEAKEMTNAIPAYENYVSAETFEKKATGGWKSASEAGFILGEGGEQTESGEPIPVLYNARMTGGKILDPWGNGYEYFIKKAGDIRIKDVKTSGYLTAPSLPNFYRLSDEERQ